MAGLPVDFRLTPLVLTRMHPGGVRRIEPWAYQGRLILRFLTFWWDVKDHDFLKARGKGQQGEVYLTLKGGGTRKPPLLILELFRNVRWAMLGIVFGDAGKDFEE